MRAFVYAQSSGFTLFIMSTASWEDNCGINDCFINSSNSRAVNFETEVIEVNFKVSILDRI